MKKNYFLISTILIIGLNSLAQDLTCKDFKNGTFIVPPTDEVQLPYKIVRKGNSQIEITEDPDNTLPPDFQKTQYVLINWIDDCNYEAKYDESKMKMSQFHKLVNENGGIKVKVLKIENKCFFIRSTLTINGNIETIDSKLCKE